MIFLVAAVILLPLVLAGPGLVDQVLPDRLDAVAYLYWPVVLLGTASGPSQPVPPGRTGAEALAQRPAGAALTLLLWLRGSALLRLILSLSIGSTSIYGPLAAPIAVLLALPDQLALLVGAAFNASLDQVSRAQRLKKWTGFSIVRFRFDRRPNGGG